MLGLDCGHGRGRARSLSAPGSTSPASTPPRRTSTPPGPAGLSASVAAGRRCPSPTPRSPPSGRWTPWRDCRRRSGTTSSANCGAWPHPARRSPSSSPNPAHPDLGPRLHGPPLPRLSSAHGVSQPITLPHVGGSVPTDDRRICGSVRVTGSAGRADAAHVTAQESAGDQQDGARPGQAARPAGGGPCAARARTPGRSASRRGWRRHGRRRRAAWRGSARAHSAQPLSPVGAAARTPRPTSRRAARRLPSSGNRSRNIAMNQAPKGTSVRITCGGMPVASPWKKRRAGRRRSAGTRLEREHLPGGRPGHARETLG